MSSIFSASFGHKIQVISDDALAAYRSETYETNLNSNESRRQESTPHEHQQNDIERFVRNREEGITSMTFSASWVLVKLVAFIIMLWITLWNLQEGSVKGISRLEEYTKTRPSADAGARTAAWWDCYLINKQKIERSEGHFAEPQAVPGTYLTPNHQSPI